MCFREKKKNAILECSFLFFMKTVVNTKLAPGVIGPYSQGVVHRNILYVSGQLGVVLIDGTMPESIEDQTKNALYNMKSIVEASGSRLDRCLKVTIFLADMNDFPVVNKIYERFFPESPPARECVEVSVLPKNGKIEISAIAYVRDDI